MASYEHQSNGAGIPPKIKLYTNHMCPYAHRAHIALKELDLPYEEVIIDLEKPREPSYLKINPRGLVPSIEYSNGILKDEIITESAIITQFLADIRPSHLLPLPMSTPTSALFRARVNFFVDTWTSKLGSYMYGILKLESGEEKDAETEKLVAAIEKEIDPLLQDAAPFFGGSKDLTLAEVQVAPFLIRFYAFCNGTLFPSFLKDKLDKLPNFSKWANAVMAKESVTYVFNKDTLVPKIEARMEKMRTQAKA